MSLYYFFASDTKLLEQRNPYIKLLSVNEAIAHGIEVHTELFEDHFDYDKPEVILYVENEEQFRYPNIYKQVRYFLFIPNSSQKFSLASL